jgi:hypothetical protein
VEHAQETDLCSKMLRIGSNLQERCSAGAEQEVIDHLFVLQSQPRQFVRNREDHVDVLHGQQFLAAFREPSVTSVGLALRTMPRTA